MFEIIKVKNLNISYIEEKVSTIKKQVGRGRPGPNTVYEDVEIKEHNLKYNFDKKAIDNKKVLSGYFVLITNKPKDELPMKQALNSYKQESVSYTHLTLPTILLV